MEDRNSKTPLERRAERLVRREVALNLEAKKVEKLKQATDAVLRSEAGRILFAHLYSYLGFDKTSLVVDRSTGGVELVTSAINEARRDVYLHLRSLGSRELVAVAEEQAEKEKFFEYKPQEEERK